MPASKATLCSQPGLYPEVTELSAHRPRRISTAVNHARCARGVLDLAPVCHRSLIASGLTPSLSKSSSIFSLAASQQGSRGVGPGLFKEGSFHPLDRGSCVVWADTLSSNDVRRERVLQSV